MSRRLLVMLTVLLMLALALPASAAERDGLAITVNCTGFTALGGSLNLNRDNTGAGRERFQIVARDGGGATIYSGPVESFFVGSSIDFPASLATDFSTAPASNPIIVSVVSAAGNGLAEQVVYSAAGRCASLPTVETEDVVVSGVTSPSVAVNILPPSGTNSDADIAALPGYALVNTSFLNLRSGDGPEYTIVGRVDGGDKLIVLGRNESLSWWFVKAGDVVGWVISDFILLRGDLTDVPEVVAVGEIALPRFFLYSDNVLRATAASGSEGLCTVAKSLEYEIVGRNSDLSQVKVNAVCNNTPVQGWLAVDQGAVRNIGNVAIPVVD
jgi:uncharacterized protein YgiM (DUF1202 family)